MSLTDKQSRFVQEYLLDLNATQAAARAGYSAKTANEQGARLLANVSVAQAVRQAQAARAERTQLTQDWVLERLRETVERCMQAEPVRDSEGGSTGVYKFNAAGANKALELIGKHLGMFVEKHEHAVTSFAISAEPVTDPELWAAGYGPRRG